MRFDSDLIQRLLRLFLKKPHLIAASIRLEWWVVATAEVLLALKGRRLTQGARQTQGLCSVLTLPCEASKLPVNKQKRRGNFKVSLIG